MSQKHGTKKDTQGEHPRALTLAVFPSSIATEWNHHKAK